MATINTIEDLLRLLDENPQWLEALRVRLLTRELIELPQTFAKFAEETRQRFEAHDKRLDAIDKRLDAHDSRFDAIDKRLDAHDSRFDRVDLAIQKLRDDIAPLKGAHARDEAIRESMLIAEELGFSFVSVLSQEDIAAMVRSQGDLDIAAADIRSFRRADLIMEVANGAGDTCYLAAEISFTANGRDTARAIRNADILRKLTGKQAWPAIAGVYRDRRIRETIESGKVSWYQLDAQVMEAE